MQSVAFTNSEKHSTGGYSETTAGIKIGTDLVLTRPVFGIDRKAADEALQESIDMMRDLGITQFAIENNALASLVSEERAKLV